MNIYNSTVQVIKISDNEEGQRIDNFLFLLLKGVPKSMIYRIVRTGKVRVNKRRIKASYKLSIDDLVCIPPVRIATRKIPPVYGTLDTVSALANCILYEDDHLLILNKPSGMAVHGGSGIKFGIIEGLRVLWPAIRFLELVHRLDRETSGVLLIAKKRSALRSLHEQLRMKVMQKDYLALVRDQWESHCKTVQAPLLKNILHNSGSRIVRVNREGKSSVTHFAVKTRYEFATLIKAIPITGRTHQIRVHALHAGHPIAFDNRYGDRNFDQKLLNTGLKRLFLHAAALRFEHPATGETIRVEAEMDEELRYCLKILSLSESLINQSG